MREHSVFAALFASTVVLAGSAFAADLDLRGTYPAEAPKSNVPVFTWTGFYVGGNVGYGQVSDHVHGFNLSNNTDSHFNLSSSGVIGGGQAGYVYQLPGSDLVLGGEADITAGSLSAKGSTGYTTSGTQVFNTHNDDINFVATVRGRVGYAFDRLLLYGTGGLAIRNGEISRTQYYTSTFGVPFSSTPLYVDKTSSTSLGYVLGGGVEYAFGDRWSVKAEYNYMRFAGIDATFPRALAVVDSATKFEPRRELFTEKLNLAKIGLNYEF